ncbi:AI-2E family transporter [Altericroceibacterium endophyticum]|uniref:AI-2E family transporter n=1 Tax=Altericroceibacterium endophyticum TaxID=1808508 RepID=A0A6I4T9T2_9SPHN|nr:AI-2E family transporter [Altericroceibacterium endophyticum]MXO66921.1 AI-2E family transporter [Altericroceibacterium endophyticum]
MKDSSDNDKSMGASPSHIVDPQLRMEAGRAFVWVAVVGIALLTVYISQSLLVIFGAMVFAAIIDGGARLLGKILPLPRSWRIIMILILATGFLVWLGYFAGSQVAQQAAALPEVVATQADRLISWAQKNGLSIRAENVQSIAGQLMSGVGTVTRALTGVFGGLTTLFLIVIIGIYVALEPRLYERGVAWILPRKRRSDFYSTITEMAQTMRRLMAGRILGMVFEGLFTYLMLAFYGVPMAVLLGILTGLLAFIPNVGAVISGLLMALVGFSVSTETGLYTIFVYIFVQTLDGYLVIPMIARKTVDLAPALVLAMQLVMGILFGILGLFLADPLLAMIKVVLEQRARSNDRHFQSLTDGTGTPSKETE